MSCPVISQISLLTPFDILVSGKREPHIVVTCLDCGKLKRFLARKNHTLWSEQKEKTEDNKEQLQGEDGQNTQGIDVYKVCTESQCRDAQKVKV